MWPGLGKKELLRYKRAGEAASEAHAMGFASFGERRRCVSQRQLPALPGMSAPSGALVALDAEGSLALSGGIPFAERYRQFKNQIVLHGTEDTEGVRPLSKQQAEQLRGFAKDASKATVVQDVAASLPLATEFTQRQAARVPGLLGLRWQPPTASLVQAR